MKPTLASRQISLQPPMTPMIDVVFLLLIFFVWTSRFDRPEEDLPARAALEALPGVQPQEPPPRAQTWVDEIVVRILASAPGAQPSYLFQGRPINDRWQLRDRLMQMAGAGINSELIISPASQVPLGEAVAVYDLARTAGFTQISFQVSHSGGSSVSSP